jgi:hypothetical protein
MFLFRSAFWLAAAYIVIQPVGLDLGAAAGALSDQAVSAGRQVAVEHVEMAECATIECAGGKLMLAAALQSSPLVDHSMQDSPTASIAPVPRPRPSWAG